MNIRSKIFTLTLLLCGTVIVILSRLFFLQIYGNEAYFKLGQRNCLREEIVVSPRGNILDCHGQLLATNRPVTHVYWCGSGKRSLTPEQYGTLEQIAAILNKELTPEFLKELQIAERTAKKLLLAEDIDHTTLSKITEAFADDQNLALETHFKRHYPYRTLACHLLGYISAFDLQAQGKMGLEKLLEDTLKGEHGTLLRTINSLGMSLQEEELKKALNGQDIGTTVDLTLQNIAESLMPEEYAGALILMDPQDGAIKALVSRPAFDPEIFLEPIRAELWQELQERRPFLNRAFDSCYPPASIFKLVTISAALEKHIITPDTHMYCEGFLSYHGRKYNCKGSRAHGDVDACDSLTKSCNVFFYNIAKRMSIDTLADYADRLGLGRKTNVLFPEKEGLIPTRAWKLTVKGERWWPGETLSAVIGQSYLLVTPIQIARMIGGIFEGYLVKPRILACEESEQESLTLNRSTRNFLQEAMKLVVSDGTGKQLSNMNHLTIYGKTGTAQTCALGNEGHGLLEHGWVVIYFKYKNYSPLVMVILIEHAGTSSVPTAIAKKYILRYRRFMELQENCCLDTTLSTSSIDWLAQAEHLMPALSSVSTQTAQPLEFYQ